MLKAHLGQIGLTVLLADNAQQGIETAIEEQPDLILLDVMMPGIDGYEACKRLKDDNRTSAIPIIFVSAKDLASEKITGLKLGAIDYIAKPFIVSNSYHTITWNSSLKRIQLHNTPQSKSVQSFK